MKSLCFFNSCQAWGGGEKWHYHAALWCRRQGYSVLVITHTQSELAQRLLDEDGITVRQLRISNLSFLNPFKILRLFKLFTLFHVDTVFLNLSADVKIAGFTAKLLGIPQIFYRRGLALPVRNSWLNRLIFSKILSGVIVNSLEGRQKMLQQNADLLPDGRVHVLYNGIDLDAYDRQAASSVYVKQEDEIVLGNAGRFIESKGHAFLIDMAVSLKKRGLKFKLLLAGKGVLELQLRQQVKERGLEREVLFLGFVETIKPFLESLDIFVFTSLSEGGANVLLEAMASGKATVAFDTSSTPEMVLHERTGLLVPPRDVAALTEAVAQLMADRVFRESLGRNGRRRAEKHFCLNTMFAGLERIIQHG